MSLCVRACIHGHAFHLPPFFLSIFFPVLLFTFDSARVCGVLVFVYHLFCCHVFPYVNMHTGATLDGWVYRNEWNVCSTCVIKICLFECLTASPFSYTCLHPPTPLFAKRLNPRRLVTVLLVKHMFSFPHLGVCLSRPCLSQTIWSYCDSSYFCLLSGAKWEGWWGRTNKVIII